MKACNKIRYIKYQQHPDCIECEDSGCFCRTSTLEYGGYYTYMKFQEQCGISKATIKSRLYGKSYCTDRDLYKVGASREKNSGGLPRYKGSDKLETKAKQLSDKWLRVSL